MYYFNFNLFKKKQIYIFYFAEIEPPPINSEKGNLQALLEKGKSGIAIQQGNIYKITISADIDLT